jgi:hypothetical protein
LGSDPVAQPEAPKTPISGSRSSATLPMHVRDRPRTMVRRASTRPTRGEAVHGSETHNGDAQKTRVPDVSVDPVAPSPSLLQAPPM